MTPIMQLRREFISCLEENLDEMTIQRRLERCLREDIPKDDLHDLYQQFLSDSSTSQMLGRPMTLILFRYLLELLFPDSYIKWRHREMRKDV